ncbi:MAG: FHA domain-containing protein [Deltaproteobacteria bacterium]|nr:FHA domain-containing protein [Deltaproteobacteria bacterium]
MPVLDTPMLFLPPREPVPVTGERSLLIGRSRGCDLQIPHSDTSRRHAEIYRTEGGFILRDLGSTNGTFVNGRPVQEHRLETGDRIQISESEITFCEITPELESTAGVFTDADTVLSERPVPVEVFRGELAEIPTFAVLQVLEMGRKTGIVMIDSEAGVGRLWLDNGHPIHAETKLQKGFDAAVTLVNSGTGRFSFEPDAISPEQTIEASVTELLLEASRIQDEERL